MDKKDKLTEQQEVTAEMKYPGVGTDHADDDRENSKMVECDVKSLNNNPRNNDLDR